MAGLTLDSGALIATEKSNRRVWGFLKQAHQIDAKVTVPAVVLAQVWRGNNAVLARLLKGCDIESLDETKAKAVGRLLAKSGTNDIVDAAVVFGAAKRGDAVVTSDPGDLLALSEAVCVRLEILQV